MTVGPRSALRPDRCQPGTGRASGHASAGFLSARNAASIGPKINPAGRVYSLDSVEKFDVEGILAFAERVLPRASDLWVQASLNQKQRLQQLFFGDGVAFDGKQFVRTAVTANAFKYLTAVGSSQNEVASPTGFEPVF